MNYRVNEIYRTLQGEGWHTGMPCTLVRLQGCPLRCDFCDTPQAQDPLGGTEYTSEELVAAVRQMHRQGDIVLITGGEPTLQDLSTLIPLLAQLGPVHLETNGTGKLRYGMLDWITVSPKVGRGFDALRAWAQTFPQWRYASELKLLVESKVDILPWVRLLKEYKYEGKVSVQPISQGTGATSVAIKASLKYGWRLSVQLHKYVGLA